MLTRRENLLIRPWQDRRFVNHRKKVEHALPAIDVKPPTKRAHVTYKLKKLQKEAERCACIEQNNFILLQHLQSIMHSCRVDNVWTEAPPNFLHRIGIYSSSNGITENCKQRELNPPCNRKERCLACSPQRIEQKKKIPEERIPWDPPRPRLSRRKESLKGPPNFKKNVQSNTNAKEVQEKQSPTSLSSSGKQKFKSKRASKVKSNKLTSSKVDDTQSKTLPNIETQSIILSRGSLKLSVNFPPHTTVILKDGQNERVLQSEFCHCDAIKPVLHTTDSKSTSSDNIGSIDDSV